MNSESSGSASQVGEMLAGADLEIAHELPGRIRLKGPFLSHPALDIPFFEGYIMAIEGIDDVRINHKASSIVIEYSGNSDIRDRILSSLAIPPQEAVSDQRYIDTRTEADVSGIIMSLVVLLVLPILPMRLKAVISWLSVSPLILEGAATLVTKGLKVEVLDATAVSLAMLRRDYFTANAVHLLLRTGDYIKHTTETNSDRLIRSLLKPKTGMAWVEKDGTESQIPVTEILPGQLVVVGTGDLIPIDGRIEQGTALVNQASVTGESVPVRKEVGDTVMSGTVVEEGRIKIRAVSVGRETTTARISRYIESSLKTKSIAQRESEKLADSLVPLTFALGGLMAVLTRDLKRAAAVFMVDYSCAIKLSTPVCIKIAMYQAGKEGVLVKGGQAIEAMAEVDTIVFDKTGTITTGQFEVTDCISLVKDLDSDGLLALAASAEEHYSHPIADAVVRAAKKKSLAFYDHSEVDFIVAHGVATYVGEKRLLIGNEHFLKEDEGIDFSHVPEIKSRLAGEGKALLFVALDSRLIGVIALRDTIRPEARAVIERLKELRVKRTVMLTGDHHSRARAIAESLGLDEFYSELLPEDKVAKIAEFQASGSKVAFVGDGINDAPAMMAADVGISMAQGSDIARATAETVLLEEGLVGVALAREVSVKTMGLIRTNFGLAVGINSSILIGATLGWLSPLASAILHNTSTVGILLNALTGVSLEQNQALKER
ncbi:MAG: heavy metal translocating P-type ATPase [Deltaproteobacteria bacterium]|nr:heavy metal translocating P-type ATPase [Deltaproteobacteria bacterium]MDL1961109.1 heavy metal translocating P-type ATPase [Deltaproteobacteria bacterium]